MTDVFISYSRSDKERVAQIARAIESEGYAVWWDAELPPHQSYGEVITAKIESAKAALVVWSPEAAASEWVRAEADAARNQKKLIQTALCDLIPPLPFNQIQCADLSDWNGEPDHPGWQKVKQSLSALCGDGEGAPVGAAAPPPPMQAAKTAAPSAAMQPLMGANEPKQGSNKAQFIIGGAVGALAVVAAGFAITNMGGEDAGEEEPGEIVIENGEIVADGAGDPLPLETPTPSPTPTSQPTATPPVVAAQEQSPPAGDGYNRDVTLMNGSGETIMYLYWSNTNDEFWGEDRLGARVLSAGENWSVTVDDGTGACAFDFMGVTASGEEIVRPNVNVCAVYQINFN